MKNLAAALALLTALIAVLAATAGAHTTSRSGAAAAGPLIFGVADDTGKYAEDGGLWFNGQLKGANMGEERWTLTFSPDRPTTIDELPFLERAAPQAQADGVRVELALYGRPARANDPTAFCAWAALVATTVQQWGIHDYIVWNEPNTSLYWSPQDDSTPAKYEALLAACYDAIHGADPAANVIGFGLSPRKGTASQSAPIPFIRGVGDAYRKSGRSTPIMDMISVHPYPNPNSPTDGPDVGYPNPDFYGIPNLDRVKQAVYDAFNGTAQPTTVNGLLLVIDEVGWQTDTAQYAQYFNTENVATITEAQQTAYVRTATEKYFACDPTITTVNWFGLVDETSRDGRDRAGTAYGGGWQAGLMTAGGEGVSQAKQAYAALASDFAAGRGACKGKLIAWTPTTSGGSTGSTGGSKNGSAQGAKKQTPLCKKSQKATKKKPCRRLKRR
jgi:polysaccharide biosynthesis protein PslG